MIKITIEGEPIPKKNNSQIIYKGRRPMIIPSDASIKYEVSSIKQIEDQLPKDFKTIDFPVNIEAVYYRKNRREVDITNLLNSTHDILSRSGVIEDDNWKIVESVNGSKIRFDKENPRTEIHITKVQGETSVSFLKNIDDQLEERKRKEREKKKQDKINKMKRAYILREEGLTYKDVGEKIGVSSSTASKYCKEYKDKYLLKGGDNDGE